MEEKKKTKIKIDSSAHDLYSFLAEHNNQLASHEPKAEAMWNSLKRRAGGKTEGMSMCYEFEIEGNQLAYIRHSYKDIYYNIHLMVVPFAKDKFQYLHFQTTCVDVFKYTSHFFDRYQERMKLKGSVKNAVKRFFKKSKSMACLYWKNDQVVYAMDDGLVLGVADQKLGMYVGCTFVSYGLLKASQRAAFDKVRVVADEMRELHADLYDRGLSFKDAKRVVSDKFADVQEAAEEIYSWYFEEGDLRLRE